MAWRNEYCVGLPRIDQQHRILMDSVSLIREGVSKRTTYPAIQSVLGQLENFARLHFAYEESSMRYYRYPRLEEHGEVHLRFMADLKNLQEVSHLADVSEELIPLIENRLLEEIMSNDRQFASWLGVTNEQGANHRLFAVG